MCLGLWPSTQNVCYLWGLLDEDLVLGSGLLSLHMVFQEGYSSLDRPWRNTGSQGKPESDSNFIFFLPSTLSSFAVELLKSCFVNLEHGLQIRLQTPLLDYKSQSLFLLLYSFPGLPHLV